MMLILFELQNHCTSCGMYRAEPDPYCYPGTTVLINCLGILEQASLDAFEAEVTAERASQPLPAGRLSYAHYRALHRLIETADSRPTAG